MGIDWRDESLFEQNMAMRCELKALRQIIDEFRSGERYLKLQEDNRRVMRGYIKRIKSLENELADAHSHAVTIRDIWTEECEKVWRDHLYEMSKKDETIRQLEDKIWENQRIFDEKITTMTLDYEDQLYEKECIINELKNKLAHYEALLGRDSTNTGMPTSQTPPGKKKRVPNGRVKTGLPKGGQPGHEKHSLEAPDETEVTEVIDHFDEVEGFCCPDCDSERYVLTGETEVKYEYDVRIVVEKKKHLFYYYRCLECGTEFRSKYPPGLKGDVQYGSGLQALVLSLTNTVNAAMNKTAMFLAGITGSELTPCEGYVAKLQKRAAKGLVQFREDLKMLLITRQLVYWDDTVIMILTQRGCYRFYGDDFIAIYYAHKAKGMKGIDEDNVLALLTSDTKVMHDHNTVNYNKKFSFENIECNQHVERDCQKNTDDTQHKWSAKLKKLIGSTIADRDKAVTLGEQSFGSSYVERFNEKLDEYLSEGWKENENDEHNYGAKDERALLRRIEKYRRNYFMWLEDFSLPTTNNLSERSLRPVKSHMKISGQFESVETADWHALIQTYTETCRRNGINEIHALQRLCEGNPYTVQEIFSKSPPR